MLIQRHDFPLQIYLFCVDKNVQRHGAGYFNAQCRNTDFQYFVNPLNAELNPVYHLLALLGAHPILHISGVRVKNVRPPPSLKRFHHSFPFLFFCM
jgi:hypothetical protein